jgi:large subunit ribosomal protein L21e
MLKHKSPRTKGKFSFSRFFQKLNEGDRVAVIRELSVNFGYSKRLQGKTGQIKGKRGSAYEVVISDLGKPKTYLIKPIHLKKMESQVQ